MIEIHPRDSRTHEFSIHSSLSVTCHINKMKEYNHDYLKDAEKASDENPASKLVTEDHI